MVPAVEEGEVEEEAGEDSEAREPRQRKPRLQAVPDDGGCSEDPLGECRACECRKVGDEESPKSACVVCGVIGDTAESKNSLKIQGFRTQKNI